MDGVDWWTALTGGFEIFGGGDCGVEGAVQPCGGMTTDQLEAPAAVARQGEASCFRSGEGAFADSGAGEKAGGAVGDLPGGGGGL